MFFLIMSILSSFTFEVDWDCSQGIAPSYFVTFCEKRELTVLSFAWMYEELTYFWSNYYVIGLFVSLDICIWKRCNCSVVWRSSRPYSYSTNNLQLNIGVSMCYGGVASYFCGQSLGCGSGENPFLQPIIYRVIVTENI